MRIGKYLINKRIQMGIENEIKSSEAEHIVRFLASDQNYGKKFTPYLISRNLDLKPKIYSREIGKILSMFAIRFIDLFGFEKLSNASYFWIKAEKILFVEWFTNWFVKEF